MLALVCKTFDGVKALELYDKEGAINRSSGLHGIGSSVGRTLEGRFRVICLNDLRYVYTCLILSPFTRFSFSHSISPFVMHVDHMMASL